MNILRKLLKKIKYMNYSNEQLARELGVKIGNNCIIGSRFWGAEPGLIEIGNHVHITSGVSFVTHDGGVWVFREEIPDFDVFGKIRIGDNTYIGNNSLILPGVTIGRNCVIGANSLVTKSIPDNSVVAGNPARYITSTSAYKEKMLPLNMKTKTMNRQKKQKQLESIPDEKLIIKSWLEIPGKSD